MPSCISSHPTYRQWLCMAGMPFLKLHYFLLCSPNHYLCDSHACPLFWLGTCMVVWFFFPSPTPPLPTPAHAFLPLRAASFSLQASLAAAAVASCPSIHSPLLFLRHGHAGHSFLHHVTDTLLLHGCCLKCLFTLARRHAFVHLCYVFWHAARHSLLACDSILPRHAWAHGERRAPTCGGYCGGRWATGVRSCQRWRRPPPPSVHAARLCRTLGSSFAFCLPLTF